MPIRWHEEDPVLLTETIRFTASETDFLPRLVEKDYFCSVLLEHLAATCHMLVFKGGTSLAKIHAGFFRLSEDLEFTISIAEASRAGRSRCIAPLKEVMADITNVLSGFRVIEPLTGSNVSTQYNGVLGYSSLVGDNPEIIRIEVGLRETTATPLHQGGVRTLLLNPLSRQELIAPFLVPCLSYPEAMAEKLRAALCRRDPAIRDFFDVDHAVQYGGFDPLASDSMDLLRIKLSVPRAGAVNITRERLVQLERQVEPELRPFLRPPAFAQFDLARAFETVCTVATELGSPP